MSAITLQPQENFVVVRQLADHTDETTYYVKATVRDSLTDTILDTLYLTDQGSGRFKKTYKVPADVSGLGRYVDITSEVYTDDTYETKATTYGDENNTYLIFDRFLRIGGGSGGADIDYKKLKNILNEGIKSIKVPDIDPKKLEIALKSLEALQKAVSSIEIPEQQAVDFSDVVARITQVSDDLKKSREDIVARVVKGIVIPKQIPTDLSPVLNKIDKIDMVSVVKAAQKIHNIAEVLVDNLDSENFEKFKKNMDDVKGLFMEFLVKLGATSNTKAQRVSKLRGR